MSKMVKGDVTRMLVIAGAIRTLATTQATAEIITRCGSLSGYSFLFPNAFVDPDRAGWRQDSLPSSETLLIYNGDKPDIIYTDKYTDKPVSARDEGATVMEVRGTNPGFRVILLIYGNSGRVEHFCFN